MLSVALIACFTGRLSLPNKHPAKRFLSYLARCGSI